MVIKVVEVYIGNSNIIISKYCSVGGARYNRIFCHGMVKNSCKELCLLHWRGNIYVDFYLELFCKRLNRFFFHSFHAED